MICIDIIKNCNSSQRLYNQRTVTSKIEMNPLRPTVNQISLELLPWKSINAQSWIFKSVNYAAATADDRVAHKIVILWVILGPLENHRHLALPVILNNIKIQLRNVNHQNQRIFKSLQRFTFWFVKLSNFYMIMIILINKYLFIHFFKFWYKREGVRIVTICLDNCTIFMTLYLFVEIYVRTIGSIAVNLYNTLTF